MKKEVTVGSGSVDRLDVKVEQCDLFSFVVVEHADTAVVELVGPRSTSIGTPNAATRLAFPDAIERPRAVAPSHCDHAKIVIAEVSQTAPAAGFGEDDFYPFVDKAAVLVVRLARNHPLPDGNKRAA